MAAVPTKKLKATDMTERATNGNGHGDGNGRSAAMQRPALKGQWSEPAVRVLRERYLWKRDGQYLEDEDGLCWRVATAVAAAEANYGGDIAAVASQFYELLVTGKFLANSPTLMNAGKDNGLQLSACFVIPVEDTIEGIFDAVKYAAIIHKSGGGCIAGDARVWSTFCGIEPIAVLFNRATADGRAGVRHGSGIAYDVRDLGIQTVSMHPTTGETGLRPVTHVWHFDVPAASQIAVVMREGTVVQTSDWHPFMVLRGTHLGETRADTLIPGDIVLGADKPDAYWPWMESRTVGSLTIDPDLGWLIGFTLGDGSFGYVPALRQYRVRWFSGTEDVLLRAQAILARHGINVSIQKDARGLLSIATLNQRFVHDLLEACGLEKFGPKDEEIRVPEIIAKSPLPVVRAFLAGLVDSDGYIAPDGSPSYISVSEAMIEDLAAMMGLLGYQPTVRVREPHGKGRQRTHTVQLCPLPRVNDLAREIGPYLAHTMRRARLGSASRRQTGLRLSFRDWRDRLASLGLVNMHGKAGGTGPCAEELSRWSCNPNGRCRRDDLLAIAAQVAPRDPELAGLMRRIATSGQEVARVERAATPKPYFDLTVEGWNTYAAGRSGLAMIHNTGFSFSRLRPEGSTVGTSQGVASGPVSFMHIFDAATEQVKQGGTRRGANMGILRVDHPDIEKFITCKLDGGVTNFNISVAATDAFMQAVKDDTAYDLVDPHDNRVVGTRRARAVWEQIVDAAWRSGDPGFVFIDKANHSKSNPTPKLELLEATNPCVTGDTLVYTADGAFRIADLAARDVAPNVALDSRLMDGVYGPAAVPFATGVKPVYRLTTAEGYEVRLTADHRVLTKARGWVAASDLRAGDKIHLLNHTGGFGGEGTEEAGRVVGWLIGDGHIKQRDTKGNPTAYLEFWGDDRDLADDFAGYVTDMVPPHPIKRESPVGVTHVAERNLARVGSTRLATMMEAEYGISHATKTAGLPIKAFAMSEAFQRGLLQALFTTDGHVSGTAAKGVSVRLTSISLPLLKDVQRMLLNFGVASRIYAERHSERAITIRERTYQAHADHDLMIGKDNVLRFADEIGFLGATKTNALHRALGTYGKRGPYRETFFATFAALQPEGEETVYDLTEPLTHSFVANGLVVHNCGEQWLGPFDACNLGSINLARTTKRVGDAVYLDWEELERVTRLSVRFLDDVIDVNPLPLPQIQEKVRANRRIGLGVMGWADLLFLLGIPYDSERALALGTEIMAKIEEWGWAASRDLAAERGPFPNFAESIYAGEAPVRNGTVTTVAPTGSISILADCSSGIEPIFALAFQHRVKQGKEYRVLNFVNPIFKEEMERRGLWSEALERHLVATGSVKGAPGVPDEVQRVYVTAQEIAPEWHVRQQAAWQKHVDNSISKTVNLPNAATRADVAAAYMAAYDTGCKGITVFRDGCKSEQVLNIGVKQEEPKPAAAPVAEAVAAAAASAPAATIKPRPDVVAGYTRKLTAPEGKVFVTINSDMDGPLEVFATVGRAGSDIEAMADGMGRLISLTLRLPSSLSQSERALAVAETLRNLGGSRSVGFGPNQIRSLPDAIGKAIAMHFGENGSGTVAAIAPAAAIPAAQLTLAVPAEARPSGNVCPQCGSTAFVLEEGCKKCHACGYSEC